MSTSRWAGAPTPGSPSSRTRAAVAALSAATSAARGPEPLYGQPEPVEGQLQPPVLARAAVEGQEHEVGLVDATGRAATVWPTRSAPGGRRSPMAEVGPDRRPHRLDGGPAHRVADQRLDLLDVVVEDVEQADLGVPALEVHQVEADVAARWPAGTVRRSSRSAGSPVARWSDRRAPRGSGGRPSAAGPASPRRHVRCPVAAPEQSHDQAAVVDARPWPPAGRRSSRSPCRRCR